MNYCIQFYKPFAILNFLLNYFRLLFETIEKNIITYGDLYQKLVKYELQCIN